MTHYTCDRCQRPIEQEKSESGQPKEPYTLGTKAPGEYFSTQKHLCPDCAHEFSMYLLGAKVVAFAEGTK
jgi:hypothetical protein